jgi:biotin synthase-related radical SAM superfamily protein
MTNLKAKDSLTIYLQRMKIEEAFRGIKRLLELEKLINKHLEYMEKIVEVFGKKHVISTKNTNEHEREVEI